MAESESERELTPEEEKALRHRAAGIIPFYDHQWETLKRAKAKSAPDTPGGPAVAGQGGK